jgi:hypothetical protein
MALAQHYGVPTRLLDWTRQARVAAYFAALEPPKPAERLAVWALVANVLGRLSRESSPLGGACVVASAPRASNPHLHAQAGVFTVQRHEGNTLRSLDAAVSIAGQAVLNGRRSVAFMHKLTLPRSEAVKLITILRSENVTALALFPGFHGVTLDILAQAKLTRDTEFLY